MNNPDAEQTFQKRATNWLMECFSMEICRDTRERNHRFLEESLELVQSLGCTANEAHQLVDYVFGRDQGDVNQEVGGVMVTLAALCFAADIDMYAGGETELARIMQPTMMAKIRAKQASKPKHSPLPVEQTGTFLGYRNANGEEMHCAHPQCISQEMCVKGCKCPVAKSKVIPTEQTGTSKET